MKSLRIAALAVASFISASALAGPVYEYTVDTPVGSASAGDIKNVTTSYDAMSEVFSWSYSIGRDNQGLFSDAFWLVVTPGENPKNDANEYAILYGDVDGDILSAYEYSGQNNANSFINPGNQLDSFVGDSENPLFTTSIDDKGTAGTGDDVKTISFSIDASVINAGNEDTDEAMWVGVEFGPKLGIWFHPSSDSTFSYSSETGDLLSYNYQRQGWYDTANRDTTVSVSEPSLLLLLALALIGLGIQSKRTFRAERISALQAA